MKKVILMFVALAVVCGCGAGKKADVAKTLIGDWEIVEAGGLATEGGFEKATISFDEKEVHGNTRALHQRWKLQCLKDLTLPLKFRLLMMTMSRFSQRKETQS